MSAYLDYLMGPEPDNGCSYCGELDCEHGKCECGDGCAECEAEERKQANATMLLNLWRIGEEIVDPFGGQAGFPGGAR